MVFNVNGIVIKEMTAGETGKRILVITREHGKMLLSARGSKNAKSGIMAATQLFSYCEFTVFEGKGFYSVTQADVIESFYGIRNDFERLAYGAYILELTERTSFEEMEDNAAFDLLLKTLSVLSSERQNPKLTAVIYIIGLLKECGFMWETDYCVNCGDILDKNAFFGDRSDGLFCHNCSDGMAWKLGSGALKAVRYINGSSLNKLFNFRVSEEVLDELWTFADINRRIYFGDKYKTLDYINNLKF
ncbi:MAG: DNA repair protein RecO [Clostridiales bacterium]|nr:DNA repair protein RecO [Clostridiales bacterium]